jgi:putative CocE/NonD family hydrolase
MKNKLFSLTLLVIVFISLSSSLFGQIRNMYDVRTPMRDGVELSSDIWLPDKPGKYPAILLRTPYLKTEWIQKYSEFGKFFAKHGYVFIVQDVRGRGDSDGEFNFFFQEARDGYDAIEWFAQQVWCNGKIGTMGLSYLGSVQWQAARENPPHLVCMASASPAGAYDEFFAFQGGAWSMGWALQWINMTSGKIFQSNYFSADKEYIWNHRPLISQDSVMGREMPLFNDWLTRNPGDKYWKKLNPTPAEYKNMDLPVLHMTGWFDISVVGTMAYWDGMNQFSPAKKDQFLIIGPWNHFQVYLGGETKMGNIELSEKSVINTKELHLAFFDCYLKGIVEKFNYPKAKLYIIGKNVWREFDEYPQKDVDYKDFYLHSKGNGNTLNGDGALSWLRPDAEPTDTFTYDPKNPAPAEYNSGAECSEFEKKNDVLVYTSDVLEKPIEILGDVIVNLYAASDALDTDFTARILDIYPNGRVINIGPHPAGFAIRARYRNGLTEPELLTPGKAELFEINLSGFGYEFLEGHRIRLEISSSSYPNINPNQNTGNPIATDTEWKIAHQTIYHDKIRPSHILLPIISNDDQE